MQKRKDVCPEPGCGQPAEFVQYLAEEILMPAAMKNEDLERKPPFDVVGRNFIVRCPVHGEKAIQVEGHHVTHIPKGKKKKKKKTPAV